MKKVVFIFLCVGILYPSVIFSQEGYIRRNIKPRTSLAEATKNLQKAIQEKDNPLMTKSLLEYAHYKSRISTDSIPSVIRYADQLRQSTTDSLQRAVFSFIEAQMIYDYYEDESKASAQSIPTDIAPDLAKIDEWDKTLFVKKISDLLQSVFISTDILSKTPVSAYAIAMNTGSDTPIFRPTMLDFLAYSAIKIYKGLLFNPSIPLILEEPPLTDFIQSAEDFVNRTYPSEKYQLRHQVMALYQLIMRYSAPGSPAYLMADLDRLIFLQDNVAGVHYPQRLMALLDLYKDSSYSVEIAIDLLYYYNEIMNNPTTTKAYLKNVADKLIARFPDYPRLNCLEQARDYLTAYNFSLNIDRVLYPGESHTLSFEYENIKQLYWKLYRIENQDSILQLADTLHLCDTLSLEMRTGQYRLPALSCGEYVLKVSPDKKADVKKISFNVSRIYAATLSPAKESLLVILTDAKTGKPLSRIPVKLFRSDTDSSYVRTVKSDRLGLLHFDANDTVRYFKPEMKGDTYYPIQQLTFSYPWYRGEEEDGQEEISLFTDRSIYRPGQTLYFSGIDYRIGEKINTVLPGKTYKVILSMQGKDIATRTVQGDSFGSFHGSFTLPSDRMNGYCQIRVEGTDSRTGVQISEYKRPTFHVLFEPVKEAVSLGQIVTVNGKAVSFSGVPVSDADVSYSIQRFRDDWWRNYNADQTIDGETVTGEAGEFTIRFVAEKSDQDALSTGTFYRYEITVNVTAVNGETQSQVYWVNVGESPLLVQLAVPQMIDKDKESRIGFAVTNAMGESVPANCKYILYSLYDVEKPVSGYDITEVDSLKIRMQVEEKVFRSDNVPVFENWNKLPSGRYRFVVQVTDPNGNLIIRNADFVLYGMQDKKPPVNTYNWAPKTSYQVADGETVDILYGTSIKQAYVLCNLYDGCRLVESRRIKVSDKNYKYRVLYKPEYGDLLKVFFTFIKEGRPHSSTIEVNRKKPDMKLSITTSSFRDKTMPGSSESWSFTVKDALGNPVSARFMAEMFDASLNEIIPHDWDFAPVYQPMNFGLYLQSLVPQNLVMSERVDTYCSSLSFDYFLYTIFRRRTMICGATQISRMAKNDIVAFSEYMAPQEESVNFADGGVPPVQYRQNFNETAFFYPRLTTNENGEVAVKFTVPESNTKWQFQALAYTKDLKYGSYKDEIISQKSLMVAPNIPRFVRKGDEVSITTLIQNISTRLMDGDFSFELFDPYTDKILLQKKLEFILESGKSKSENVSFVVPEEWDVLGIRVKAVTPKFSDGEQHIIPVLPSRTLVTESEPFVLKGGKETETVRMSGMSKNAADNYRMVLEYTANPLWYVVQALPSIKEISGTNVVTIAASLYGNTVASVLARQNPDIVSALQTWKIKNETGSVTVSPLEKNEELKSVLITETPWALDAQNETERIRSLSNLLDVSRIEQLQNDALELLGDLQKPDGGWGWMKQMPASFSMTTNTLEVLSRLSRLGGIQYDESDRSMQMKAINYLDSCIVLDRELREEGKRGLVSSYNRLLYIYVRSSYRDIPLAKALDAHKVIVEYIKSDWPTLSLYGKAIAAVSLYRYGFADEAREILESLREYSTTTKELGMFWQNNRSEYAYRNSAIQVHTAIMQAFAEIDPESKSELNEMKRWLIMQKQTQNWGSVPSTVDAIDAILNTGDYMLSPSKNPVKITWGKTVLKPEVTDGFTGYERYVRQGDEITPDLATVEISADQEQPSWGALYRQYFADFIDVQSKAVEGLSIDKQFFVEQLSGKNKAYVPLNKVTLKSGDKVNIRLTIRTDRDLSFVHVKDQRPACFEPIDRLSYYECNSGACYYREIKDAVTNLYFDFLPKGTYVFSYDVWVDRPGVYHNGISTIQCLYAPQWVANTGGRMIIVK